MSITRAPRPESNFYILDKRISEDQRLSWGARGLLIFLLGKPDSWKVSVTNLRDETRNSMKPTGRDGVYGLIEELISAGYVIRSQDREETGGFSKASYIVHESPLPETPYTANPYPAKPTLVSIEGKQELKIKNPSCVFASKDQFEVFWKLYPRKVSKSGALRSWLKIQAADVEQIMQALPIHCQTEQWIKNNGQFIPHAATWLNQKRWEDEVKPYVAGQANTGRAGAGRLSAVDQVRAANDAAEARRRAARSGSSGPGDLQEPPPFEDGRDWEGEFASIDPADGKIVGDDGWPLRP